MLSAGCQCRGNRLAWPGLKGVVVVLLLVAPATANQIGNYANGLAPDSLSSIYLATQAKVVLAPAMNGKMYRHPATERNLSVLRELGVTIIEPESGELACGYEGVGRMASPEAILQEVNHCLVESS